MPGGEFKTFDGKSKELGLEWNDRRCLDGASLGSVGKTLSGFEQGADFSFYGKCNQRNDERL
ncbi:hypothetical protein D3C86_1992660 [compost metagenome]